ncbi:MAG TPA: hypothetical protein PKM49_08460, partial [Thermotogota bacterium]|nr:hypothetical protein [Thermotogota bacterium]
RCFLRGIERDRQAVDLGIGKGYGNDLSRDFVGFLSLRAGYPAITPRGHHGVSASSFRDGSMRFRTTIAV